MKVTVFGMGYVGCVSAACLAKLGHEVTGVDVDGGKVEMINRGRSPIIEPGLDEILRAAIASGRLRATTDPAELGDVSLISVGTPSNGNGSLGLDQVTRVAEQIGALLKRARAYHVINFRSTVLPGTVCGRVVPVIEVKSQKKVGRDFGVCMNPEFLRETTAVEDFYNPPLTVIGAHDERSAEVVAQLYREVNAPIEITSIPVAEMLKYACNAFHAVKVTFANEIGNICKRLGVDSYRVMELFCKDMKLNLSAYYLKPGFAFGGSCLPKDLRALLHKARVEDIELPLLGSVLRSNHDQIERAYEMIRRTGKSRIGILGLSFKAGSDDLRESPMVMLVETLIGKGYEIMIYDEEVSLANVFGKNRRYIETVIPHISRLLKPSLDEVFEGCEVIVVTKKNAQFVRGLRDFSAGKHVIDLVRIVTPNDGKLASYEGICW